jgi:GT2 family glycosyltransferase
LNHEQQAQSAPQLSVVIVNWNTREEIRNCLKSLFPENPLIAKEIIVVDNASSDGSTETIPHEFPTVHFIANAENLGYAEACNQGILLSQADFVLLLNPDTVVNETALHRMVQFLTQHPRAGGVGCALLFGDGSLQRSWYAFPNPLNFFLYHSVLSLFFQRLSATFYRMRAALGMKSSPRRVDWLMGSCLMLRRTALEEVGLLDPQYFMYSEDTDWCRRAARRGRHVYYLPDVTIVHLHKRSSAKRRYFTLVRLFKSLRRYCRKYGSPASLSALKYAVTADMLIRLFAFGIVKIVRPSRSSDIVERISAVKDVIRIYWRQDMEL